MLNDNKTILVTGAKGFLGREIAKRLFASGHKLKLLIRNNGCSAGSVEDFIRDGDTDEAINESFLNNVEIIEGNITSELLGLDEDDYYRLCSETDEVFHCAAVTNFESQRDDELMMVNVGGTENLLRFANTSRKVKFHYISTAYVSGRQDGVVCEEEIDKEPQFNNKYERSKYIAEKTVIKYTKENTVPFTIYRPSIIVGDSRTGFTRKYDNLYLFAKILHNIKIRHINHQRGDFIGYEEDTYSNGPDTDITIRVPGNPDAPINLVPIDYVADAIVAISGQGETVDSIFHIANPNPPQLEELRDIFTSVLDIKGVNLSIEGEIERKQLSAIEKLFLRRTRTYYSYLFSKLHFDCRNTQNALDGTGISCPAITTDLVKLLMDYAISNSWKETKPIPLQKVEIC